MSDLSGFSIQLIRDAWSSVGLLDRRIAYVVANATTGLEMARLMRDRAASARDETTGLLSKDILASRMGGDPEWMEALRANAQRSHEAAVTVASGLASSAPSVLVFDPLCVDVVQTAQDHGVELMFDKNLYEVLHEELIERSADFVVVPPGVEWGGAMQRRVRHARTHRIPVVGVDLVEVTDRDLTDRIQAARDSMAEMGFSIEEIDLFIPPA